MEIEKLTKQRALFKTDDKIYQCSWRKTCFSELYNLNIKVYNRKEYESKKVNSVKEYPAIKIRPENIINNIKKEVKKLNL